MVERISPINSVAKRCLDLFLGSIAIVLFSPLLTLVALFVAVRLGRPVLFVQQRPGLNGKPFTLYKFRTMTDERNEDGELLSDQQRLTRLGSFLRGTSIDELPELFNVLKGEMSLVGPRPLLMQYLPYYSSRESLRNSVRPGITGWAQVHGRNFISWDQRLEMDVWYIENWSLLHDIKILLKTISTVVRREGVSVDSYVSERDLDEERRDSLTF
ncbi:MAG: sugar transferase [Desulfuromonadales bacterium]|nr:sugar transferase [Desulfuromonadales bacterium]